MTSRSSTCCSVTAFAGNFCDEPVSLTGDPAADATITAPATVCSHSVGNTASVPDAGLGATYVWTISGGYQRVFRLNL